MVCVHAHMGTCAQGPHTKGESMRNRQEAIWTGYWDWGDRRKIPLEWGYIRLWCIHRQKTENLEVSSCPVVWQADISLPGNRCKIINQAHWGSPAS